MLDLMNIIKQYGWQGLVFAALLYIFYRTLSFWVTSISDVAKQRLFQKKQDKLIMHSFFNDINYMLNVEVYSLPVFPDKPVRQALTRDLILCSLSSMQEAAEKIASSDHSDWQRAEWTFNMRTMLNEMNTTFLNKCVQRGIPEVVYSKYLEWYFHRLNSIRSLVDRVSFNEKYPTLEAKTSAIFEILTMFIVTMMGDCRAAMEELNGDLTGLQYRGGVIEALHE